MPAYKRLGPDGKWYQFNIAGNEPSPEESARIDKYLFGSAPEPEAPKGDVTWDDYGQALKGGIGDLASGFGYLTGDPEIEGWARDVQQNAELSTSEAAKQAQEQGVFGGGGMSALGLGAARSLPSMVPGALATLLAARFAPGSAPKTAAWTLKNIPGMAKAAGRIAAAEGIPIEQAATRLIIGALAGSTTEGLTTAGISGADAKRAVLELAARDPLTFRNSEIGQKYLKQFNGNLEQAAAAAAEEIARDVAIKTGLTSGAIALPGAGIEAALLGQGIKGGLGGALRGAGLGSGQEAIEEFGQSATESLYRGQGLSRLGVESPSIQDILRAGAEGAAIGGLLGGAMGGVGGGFSSRLASDNERAKDLAQFKEDNNVEEPAKPASQPAPSLPAGVGKLDIGRYGSGISGFSGSVKPAKEFGAPFSSGEGWSFGGSPINGQATLGQSSLNNEPPSPELSTGGVAAGKLEQRPPMASSVREMDLRTSLRSRPAGELAGVYEPPSVQPSGLAWPADSLRFRESVSDLGGPIAASQLVAEPVQQVSGSFSPVPRGEAQLASEPPLTTSGEGNGFQQVEGPNAGNISIGGDFPFKTKGRFADLANPIPSPVPNKVGGNDDVGVAAGFKVGNEIYFNIGDGFIKAGENIDSAQPSNFVFMPAEDAVHADGASLKIEGDRAVVVDESGNKIPLMPDLRIQSKPEMGLVPIRIVDGKAQVGEPISSMWEAKAPASQVSTSVPIQDQNKSKSAAPSPEESAAIISKLKDTLKNKAMSRGVFNPYLNLITQMEQGSPEGSFTLKDNKAIFELALSPAMLEDEETALNYLSAVMDHEIIHALFAQNALTPDDKAKLFRFVSSTPYRTRSGDKRSFTWLEWAQDKYGDVYAERPPESIKEEAVAEAFRHWAKDKSAAPGVVNSIFHKIVQYFKGLADAIFGSGAERVFQDIYEGRMRGEGAGDSDVRYSLGDNTFYSPTLKAMENSKQAKALPSQWLGIIKNMPGIKPEEIKWLGLEEWLSQQNGWVSKEQLLDFIKANQVQVKDIIKSDKVGLTEAEESELKALESRLNDGDRTLTDADVERAQLLIRKRVALPDPKELPKYGKWQLPGGDNYTELLLEFPQSTNEPYKSSHWREPNILAHVRFNERNADGKRVLFVEEIQSDWHQSGRKHGYAGRIPTDSEIVDFFGLRPGVNPADYRSEMMNHGSYKNSLAPDAPFKTTWPELALKRMIRWAAENGFDSVAWTPGEVQVKRYDLRKQISEASLHVNVGRDGKPRSYYLYARNHNGANVISEPIKDQKELANYIGEEVADKFFSGENKNFLEMGIPVTLSGIDLSVGGKGMGGFYDKILVDTAKGLGKKFGFSVAKAKINLPTGAVEAWSFPVTDAMKKSVGEGLPMFSLPEIYSPTKPLPTTGKRKLDIEYAAAYEAIYKGMDKAYRFSGLPKFGGMPAHLPAEPVYNAFRKFQSRSIDLARFIDMMKESGGKVEDAMNPILSFTRMREKVNQDIGFANHNVIEPAIKAGAQLGFEQKDADAFLKFISSKDKQLGIDMANSFGAQDLPPSLKMLGIWMHARHAPERNAYLKSKWTKTDPDTGDIVSVFDPQKNGAGLTNEEARWIMDYFAKNPAKVKKMEAAADLFSAVIKETNRINRLGKLTPDFEKNGDDLGFRFFVPLVGKADIDGSTSGTFDMGYNLSGRETKKAYGRESLATEIIPEIIRRLQRSINRANHNGMVNDFINMVEENSDSLKDFAKVIETPKRRPVDRGDRFGYVNEPMDQDPLHVVAKDIAIDEEGKEYSKLRVVRLDPSQRKLADFLNGKDLQKPGDGYFLVKFMLKYNRMIGALVTRFNPEFGLSNLPRDIGTAIGNVAQYKGVSQVNVAKDAGLALKSLFKHAINPKYSDSFTEIRDRAAKYGALTSDYGLNDPFESLNRMVKQASTDPSKAKKVWDSALDYLSSMNAAIENASRIAVIKNMLNAGYSEDAAMYAGKTITVNFDDGGTLRNYMNAGYLFYNASIQGTFGIFQAAARSPKVRKYLYSVAIGGALIDQINRFIAPEDENGRNMYDAIEDYIKERNMIIMSPAGDGYIKIPLPYGYHSIYNMGRNFSAVMSGNKSIGDGMGSTAKAVVEGFNPLGGTNSWLNFFSPTILDPWVDIAQNKNFANIPIYPEEKGYGPSTPKSQLYWNNTNPAYTVLSEILRVPGTGTDKLPGIGWEVSPNEIEYVVETLTGGLGALANRFYNLGSASITGDFEDMGINDIPFARKLIGNISGRTKKSEFYAMRDEFDRIAAEVNDARKDGDIERIRDVRERYPEIWANLGRYKILNNRRNSLLRKAKAIEDNERLPADVRAERAKKLREAADSITDAILALKKD